MNCLSYALEFWNNNPAYKIYYNNDHAINSDDVISGNGFIPLAEYGLEMIKKSFSGQLLAGEIVLLEKYFKEECYNKHK